MNSILLLSGRKKKVSPNLTLYATTTGAQTLTINGLTVAATKTVTVDWGDGSSNPYTGSGLRSHAYAGAGTWKVTFSAGADIRTLILSDTKISGAINRVNPMPSGITDLEINNISGLNWVVSPSAPMPSGATVLQLNNLAGLSWGVSTSVPMPTGLTYVFLNNLPGLTWTVSASVPMPTGLTDATFNTLPGLTWSVSASAPMPANLTSLLLLIVAGVTVSIEQWSRINAIRTLRFENSLNAAAVGTVLQGIWNNKANYTYATPSLDLLGNGNAAPAGTYQTASPPTTANEYKYDLVNGSFTPAGPEWTVQTA